MIYGNNFKDMRRESLGVPPSHASPYSDAALSLGTVLRLRYQCISFPYPETFHWGAASHMIEPPREPRAPPSAQAGGSCPMRSLYAAPCEAPGRGGGVLIHKSHPYRFSLTQQNLALKTRLSSLLNEKLHYDEVVVL